jgi:hypothetical protein
MLMQKERLLNRELSTVRAELSKQALRVTEAVAAQQSMQERMHALQKEASEKDGLYQAKCKELSVAKILGGPSGIGLPPFSTMCFNAVQLCLCERADMIHRLLRVRACCMYRSSA